MSVNNKAFFCTSVKRSYWDFVRSKETSLLQLEFLYMLEHGMHLFIPLHYKIAWYNYIFLKKGKFFYFSFDHPYLSSRREEGASWHMPFKVSPSSRLKWHILRYVWICDTSQWICVSKAMMCYSLHFNTNATKILYFFPLFPKTHQKYPVDQFYFNKTKAVLSRQHSTMEVYIYCFYSP